MTEKANNMVTRRKLLVTSTLATAGAAFGAQLAGGDAGWFDKPMRWAQLNSTEDDAAEMDIGFWMDYFKRIHADGLCITAGGVVAFYPTKVKYHHPSQWLSKRPDYFSQVLDGCKKLGMVVIARTDPHATYDDVQHDPARRNYILWREKRLFELWRLWDGEIQKINPKARYIANSGGGATSGLDMRTVGELTPTLFADRQGRSGVMAPWANGKNGKEYRSTLGRKAIGGIFHNGVVSPHRWPDSVQNGNETRIWVLDGVANGLRPWFNKVGASVHD